MRKQMIENQQKMAYSQNYPVNEEYYEDNAYNQYQHYDPYMGEPNQYQSNDYNREIKPEYDNKNNYQNYIYQDHNINPMGVSELRNPVIYHKNEEIIPSEPPEKVEKEMEEYDPLQGF